MLNRIILDNWTLQEIQELYSNGLSNDSASKLLVDKENDVHSYQDISKGFVQIEALFNFLQSLVLRDEIVVDSRFTSAWDQSLHLKELENESLIKSHNFKKGKIFEIRKTIVDKACVTNSIKKIQRQNEKQYKQDQTTVDQLMSQVIWGGAGMFARSQVYETFYLPHPLRKYAFQQTPVLGKGDATSQTMSLINSSRTKVFQYQNDFSSGQYVSFSLPPIIVNILEESNDIDDLFEVALQVRDEYQKLRSWIKEFQVAIESDDPKQISKYSDILQSVDKHIKTKYSQDKYGSLSLDLDLWTLTPSISKDISINSVLNKFGIRSTLNDLILTKIGRKSLEKLFILLGERNSVLSERINELFIENYS